MELNINDIFNTPHLPSSTRIHPETRNTNSLRGYNESMLESEEYIRIRSEELLRKGENQKNHRTNRRARNNESDESRIGKHMFLLPRITCEGTTRRKWSTKQGGT
jgi:hypothetical protein